MWFIDFLANELYRSWRPMLCLWVGLIFMLLENVSIVSNDTFSRDFFWNWMFYWKHNSSNLTENYETFIWLESSYSLKSFVLDAANPWQWNFWWNKMLLCLQWFTIRHGLSWTNLFTISSRSWLPRFLWILYLDQPWNWMKSC